MFNEIDSWPFIQELTNSPKYLVARKYQIPVVHEDFLWDYVAGKDSVDLSTYDIENYPPSKNTQVRTEPRFKGIKVGLGQELNSLLKERITNMVISGGGELCKLEEPSDMTHYVLPGKRLSDR